MGKFWISVRIRERIISLLIDLFELRIDLINIYVFVNLIESKVFFIICMIFLFFFDSIIIGGDFNCYDCDLDKFDGNVFFVIYFSEFKFIFKFVDIWRKFYRRFC